jgi:hypothetical protein
MLPMLDCPTYGQVVSLLVILLCDFLVSLAFFFFFCSLCSFPFIRLVYVMANLPSWGVYPAQMSFLLPLSKSSSLSDAPQLMVRVNACSGVELVYHFDEAGAMSNHDW